MEQTEGYLYIATGNRKYLVEAFKSAESLRKVESEAKIALIADSQIIKNEEALTSMFDDIIIEEPIKYSENDWKNGLCYKVKQMYLSPYDKTIFVDTDTYFTDTFKEIFRILNYYDLCIAHAPNDMDGIYDGDISINGYQGYNSGIVCFRKNQNISELFDTWVDKILNRNYKTDQGALMEALLFSNCKIYVLRNNYNCRSIFLNKIIGKVVLIHGRHKNIEKIAKRINYSHGDRVWLPHLKFCLQYNMLPMNLVRLIFKMIKHSLSKKSRKKYS